MTEKTQAFDLSTTKINGVTLLSVILEGAEDQRRQALGILARQAANVTSPAGTSRGELLIEFLRAQRSISSSLRERLHAALREVGQYLAPALARLASIYSGMDQHLILDAARVVATPDIVPTLIPILSSSDRWSAVLALQAIAAAGGSDAVRVLVEALAIEDLRWSAVALLADMKAKSAVAQLARYAFDPSAEVRLEVIRAFSVFSDARTIPLLRRILEQDRDQRVRDAALATFKKLATQHGVHFDETEIRNVATLVVSSDRTIDRLLREARLAEASDVHLVPELPPAFRIHGEIVDVGRPLTREETERIIKEILPQRIKDPLEEGMQADFPYVVPGLGRHRVNVFMERRGLSAVIRIIPLEPPSFNQVGLPPQVKGIVSMQRGLVIVTGRTGSGKTTTMAALVNLINESKPVHIVTLEDPIEYLHERRRGLVNQRELGRHFRTFAAALRSALREDPDVIVVGEMRDLTTMRLAVEAAETGHLVIATLHTPSAVGAVQRLVEAFPVVEQQQLRLMISDSLRLVIAQSLLRRASGGGRVPVFELLFVTPAISGLIRENKFNQIAAAMQTGKADGMITMDSALMELMQAREITSEEAFRHAMNKEQFRNFVSDPLKAG